MKRIVPLVTLAAFLLPGAVMTFAGPQEQTQTQTQQETKKKSERKKKEEKKEEKK